MGKLFRILATFIGILGAQFSQAEDVSKWEQIDQLTKPLLKEVAEGKMTREEAVELFLQDAERLSINGKLKISDKEVENIINTMMKDNGDLTIK